jgi:Flp pilus assembly protein TadD/ADP-heptose:LPS heptosyltransferase
VFKALETGVEQVNVITAEQHHRSAHRHLDDQEYDEAIAELEQAAHLAPENSSLLHDLAVAYAKSGRPQRAIDIFGQLIESNSDDPETYRNLAIAYEDAQQIDSALAAYETYAEVLGSHADAQMVLASAFRRHKRPALALEVLEGLLQRDPRNPQVLHDVAVTLSDLSRFGEAQKRFEEAIAIRPSFASAQNNLGILLEDQGEMEAAIQCFEKAIELQPMSEEMHNNLGVALASLGRYPDAIECYRKTIALNPDSAQGYNNLGNALRSDGQVEEAERCLRHAIRLQPDYAEAYNNLGIVLAQRNRSEEAIACYDRAIHFKPEYAEAHMNRALSFLGRGDFTEGWIEYEWRWKTKEMASRRLRRFQNKHWDGSPLDGKRIWLYYEQGIGDTLQFLRYAKFLKQQGATITLEVQEFLHPLLSGCPWIDQLVAERTAAIDCDYHAPLLSLPGIIGTTLDDVPCDTPYLLPNEESAKRWEKRLAEIDGFKIGIAWQGNPQYRGDRLRSIPLEQFAALACVEGVTLISLQKGLGTEQLEQAGIDVVAFDDLDTKSGAFVDTSAIMESVDLVVTSDTAIPHLAGALGVPVWMATPYAADWRWLEAQEDSPWYPTMRLFRQQEEGDWETVFAEIAGALMEYIGKREALAVPVAKKRQEEAREHHEKGIEAFGDGRLEEAEQCFVDAKDANPRFAEAHHDLGVVLARGKRLTEAVAMFREALEQKPKFGSAHNNLGLAHLELGKSEDAVFHFREALKHGNNKAETHNNLGVGLMQLAKPHEAIESYRQAAKIRPDYPEAHVNMARAMLLLGDYKRGWREYEWRLRCKSYERREFRKPRWAGTSRPGERVLLHAEQGLGDTLQFIRFAPIVQQSGAKVLVECQPSLAPLLSRCRGIDQVVARGEPLPDFDSYASLMSLPSLLETTLYTVPAFGPYLFADPNRIQQWQEDLAGVSGFRVGIAWQGNPEYEGDSWRSVELELFEHLAKIEGVDLISLQKGAGQEQIDTVADRFGVIRFQPEIDTEGAFLDTAAIMQNLDLVVCTDSSIAHLAGGLGVPTWVAIPHVPDFRWLRQRNDSPWYPTIELFRQGSKGDWEDVFDRMAAKLRERVIAKGLVGPSNATSTPVEAKAQAHHQEGIERMRRGEIARAEIAFRQSVLVDPQSALAHHDLGVVLARQRKLSHAVMAFEQALATDPDLTLARKNLGLARLESGQLEEAIEEFNLALRSEPDSPDVQNHLGVALAGQGRFEEAAAAYRRAVELRSDFPEACNNLGNALKSLGRADEAIEQYEAAIQFRAEYAEAHNNLGTALTTLDRLEDGVDCFREAVRIRPDYAEAHNNLGVSLADLHRPDEAIEAFERALVHRPEHPETHRNLAMLQLMKGRFEKGWPEYEWRLRCKDAPQRSFPCPTWDGTEIRGKLLLHAEQGLGDTFQFLRYVSQVRQRCEGVLVECQPSLVPLLSQFPEIDGVIPHGEPWPQVDAHLPLLSLPFVYGTRLDTIPQNIPYIHSDGERKERWKTQLETCPGRKVGVAWQGSSSYGGDRQRSIDLAEFAPLARIESVSLISVQKGLGIDQIEVVADRFEVCAFDDLDKDGAFLDTAAILANLDLLVASDSAIVHLAGAMGVPVWVPLCRASDWRWMRERDDSPWYPTMRLFRQQEWGRWGDVFQQVAEELRKLCHNSLS